MAEKLVSQKKKEFQDNHEKVMDAYMQHVHEHGKAPTKVELERVTGLSKMTVRTHVAQMQLSDVGIKYKLRAATILEALCKKAEEGDVGAAKLVLGIAYGWSEKSVVEHKNTQINAIIPIRFGDKSLDDVKRILNGEALKMDETQNVEYEEINYENQQ